MRRSATTLLLAAVFLISGVTAAVDPGRQDPIGQDQPINAIAIAPDTGRFGVVTDDVSSSSGQSPEYSVWALYGADGKTVLQEGHADPEECGILGPSCYNNHAVVVAIDADGDKMVVGSTASSGGSVLTFITDSQWIVHQEELTGTITDVDISDDGAVVVASTDRGVGAGNRGLIYRVSWFGNMPSWSHEVEEGATDVAISDGGHSIAAAAGGAHYRYRADPETVRIHDNYPGTAGALSFADDSDHLSASGSSNGRVLLYTDGSDDDQWAVNFRDKQVAVRATAFTPDGTLLGIGNAAGDVWIYDILPDLNQLKGGSDGVQELSFEDDIDDLAFSDDGAYLAVAAADTVALVATGDGSIVWQDTLEGSIGQVGITADGAVVLAATSDAVYRYLAVHDVQLDAPATVTAPPGQSTDFQLTVTNAGNRPESLALEADLPANLTLTLALPDLPDDLAADAAFEGTATITVPATAPPGSTDLTLNVTREGEVLESTTVTLSVPENRDWRVNAGGRPVSLGVNAGQSVVFVLDLANLGNVDEDAPVNVAASPGGWDAEVSSDLGVAPGATEDLRVTVTSPGGAAELDQGTVSVQVDGDEVVELTATVAASFGVQLTAPAGQTIEQGERMQFPVTVTNAGNTVDGFRLDASGAPTGWTFMPLTGNPHTINQLEAGESADITLILDAPATASTAAPQQLFVQATSLGDPGEQATRTLLVTVEEPSEESPTGGGSNQTPGPGTPFLVLGLVGAALVVQRRQRRG